MVIHCLNIHTHTPNVSPGIRPRLHCTGTTSAPEQKVLRFSCIYTAPVQLLHRNRRCYGSAAFTLHRYNFCTGTEGVTVQLRLHCSGAEVAPDSLTVFTVPVAFVNQIAVLLLGIVEEQKYISHVPTTRHSIVRSFFS